jgi:hypothetical protein
MIRSFLIGKNNFIRNIKEKEMAFNEYGPTKK